MRVNRSQRRTDLGGVLLELMIVMAVIALAAVAGIGWVTSSLH